MGIFFRHPYMDIIIMAGTCSVYTDRRQGRHTYRRHTNRVGILTSRLAGKMAKNINASQRGIQARGVDLTNLCPDVCVKDSETHPF